MATQLKSFDEFFNIIKNKIKDIEKYSLQSINDLADIGQSKSKSVVAPYVWKGTLINSILKKKENVKTIHVITECPYANEIEEGLKVPEFRRYSDNPKLEEWVQDKFGYVKGVGFLVGGKNSKIHPYGIHFMKKGYEEIKSKAGQVIDSNLSKVR